MKTTMKFLATLLIVIGVFATATKVHAQCNIITTVAGNGSSGYSGDGGAATAATMNVTQAVAFDSHGNMYIVDWQNFVVRKVNTSGIISTFAGNGSGTFSGDGGPATAASFYYPTGVAVDTSDNVYIADQGNGRIRKVNTSGIISTFAGSAASSGGDGGPATAAGLNIPYFMALDHSGNMFIADKGNNRIRKVNSAGIISTVAGSGSSSGYSGDGGPATAALLNQPMCVALDGGGNLFIADYLNHSVRKVNTSGIISTIAGNGTIGFTGDGSAATAAELDHPTGVCADSSGNIYIAVQGTSNNRIRKIDVSGVINTISGSSTIGYAGDGGPASAATLSGPWGVVVYNNNIYITDQGNSCIRKITSGNPAVAAISGATSVSIGATTTLTDATSGGSWSTSASSIASVNSSGVVTGVATGSSTISYSVTNSCGTTVQTLAMTVSGISCDYYITTIAGNGTAGYVGDGGAATGTQINIPNGVCLDASGNIYIADVGNHCIRKVSTSGIITTVAGTPGTGAFSGDGGQATAAKLVSPQAVTFDGSGNMLISDWGNHRIRKVTPAGIISTIAGTGGVSCGADGVAATTSALNSVFAIAADAAGNVYLSDESCNRIRKINSSGIISTIAGTGTAGFTGDGGAATNARINRPYGLTFDAAGNLIFADFGNNRIRMINTSGIINTIAGTGSSAFGGDGGQATAADIWFPSGVAVDASGKIFVNDGNNNRIREIATSGIIRTIAGAGTSYYGGDGGLATAAGFQNSQGNLVLDGSGLIYFSDNYNSRIRKLTSGPIVAALSGTTTVNVGSTTTFTDATSGGTWSSSNNSIATVSGGIITGVAVGTATISYSVTTSCGTRIATLGVTVNPATPTCNYITTILGTGSATSTGDGGAATAGTIYYPRTVAMDAGGNIYVSENGHRIRKINPSGIVSTFAGTGTSGFSGDGGQATAAKIFTPYGIYIDAAGNVYFADRDNNRVRKINTSGIISTVAGTGSAGMTGDGGQATAATFNRPYDVTIDAAGNMYIVDGLNNKVRKVDASGIITTIAGTGTPGFGGDGGQATAAMINSPSALAMDASGNIFISDYNNNRVRKVTPSGIISTFAGTGTSGFSGDGGQATAAKLYFPMGLRVDRSGNLLIADSYNDNIRRVTPGGVITSVAGINSPTYSGDGGAATAAAIYLPFGMVTDSAGNIYIADTYNNRVRKVNSGNPAFSAISGATSVTVGSTTTLTDATSGGSWSTSASSIASVNSSGVVTGVATGSATISYSVTNSCGTTVMTLGMTITGSSCNIITTIAGNGTAGYSGDGGAATAALVSGPHGVWVDAGGNIFVAEPSNNIIRKISASGIVTTVAGTGTSGFSGDGGPATNATLSGPFTVICDPAGNIYTTDNNNNRIRKITPAGIISTFAGTGATTTTGDGGQATAAGIYSACGLAIDSAGNIYFAQQLSHVVRKISPSGIVSTVAGTGSAGYSGDGGAATAATFNYPNYIHWSNGFLYISDNGNHRVRKVNSSGIVSTVAGDGTGAYGGDGWPATSAQLYYPAGIGSDAAGEIFISVNGRIRKVDLSGVISTVAGSASSSFGGDGGPATAAGIGPNAVTIDASGNMYIADYGNNRVRKVTSGNPTVAAISGATSVTIGSITTLTDATSGGSWSTSASSIASVNSSGVVTGVAAGNATISYSVTNSCGTTVQTFAMTVVGTCGIITTIAGNGTSGYTGDGGAATAAQISIPWGVSLDPSGNVYFGDGVKSVRKISTAGIITTVAGNGTAGYSGDGGAATNAQVNGVNGVWVDATGQIYISDYGNNRIRRINTSGIISTIAGTGTAGYSGDGGPATAATLNHTSAAVADAAGNVYICDNYNNVVRKINTSGIISTIAGTGTGGYSGDGGAATAAMLNGPWTARLDAAGNIYIADFYNNRIRKINTSGIISTIAGTGTAGFAGDGGAATSAQLNGPADAYPSVSGNIYISDETNQRIRVINTSGIITTITGNGTAGFSGDGGAASSAQIRYAEQVAVDAAGNIFIADNNNQRIRKITSGNRTVGAISGATSVTVGSTTTLTDTTAGGSWSTSASSIASVNSSGVVTGVAAGNATVSYSVTNSCGTTVMTLGVTVISSCGIITTIAGTGTAGYSGDGGAATSAQIHTPAGVYIDASANVYIIDQLNGRIRKVTPAGVISTFAGNGSAGFSGDGGQATAAALNDATTMTQDAAGNFYIADRFNYCIRKISTSGIISTVAGIGGSSGFTGDGGQATAAKMYNPTGIVTDAGGNIYVTDQGNSRIRKITAAGIITTIAGTGTAGFGGDGGQATAAQMDGPTGIMIDGANNLYFADQNNQRIRKITPAGIISTIAGSGTMGFAGDGGPATAGQFHFPSCLGMDGAGNIFVTDQSNQRVREISATGIISTVAGNGTATYSGDGGPSTAALLSAPWGLAVDNSGNVIIGDQNNQRIRKITSGNPTVAAISGLTVLCPGNTATLTDGTAGGSWSSSNTAVATISSGGVVTAVAYGSTTITYSVTNSCGTTNVTATQVVNPTISQTMIVDITTGIGFSGDGSYASYAYINDATFIAVDTAVNLMFFSDQGNHRLRAVQGGIIGSLVDGGSGNPIKGIAVSPVDNATFFVINSTIYRWTATSGSAVVFSGIGGAFTEGGPASAETFTNPVGLACDNAGNLYVADQGASAIRVLNLTTGLGYTYCSAATSFIAMDNGNNLFYCDTAAHKIMKVTPSKVQSVYAGTGSIGYSGNGGPATAATLRSPIGISADRQGNVYFTDRGNVSFVVRKIDYNGVITNVAGSDGAGGYNLSSSDPTQDAIGITEGTACDRNGAVYVGLGGVLHTIFKMTTSCPCAGSISAGTAHANTPSGCSLNQYDLNLTGATTATGITFLWQSSPDNATWTDVSGAMSSSYTAVITSTVYYRCKVTCTYSGSTAYTAGILLNYIPMVGAITGPTSVAMGSTITLSDTTSGGTWSSSTSTVATVSSGGVVTGVTMGVTVISYSVTNSCGTYVVTHNDTVTNSTCSGTPAAGTVSASVITSCSLPFSSTLTASGSSTSIGITYQWQSSADSSTWGNISGATSLSYAATVASSPTYYRLVVSCASSGLSANTVGVKLSLGSAPFVATISGPSIVCIAGNVTLTDATAGGVWSSASSGIATVSTTGVITGVTAGAAVISYTVTNSCGTTSVTYPVTVIAPTLPAITGPSLVCTGNTIALSDTTSGGTWTSSNTSIATVVSATGVVTGVAVGSVTITYAVTNSCGTLNTTQSVTVGALSAGTITGSSTVCIGFTTALADATSGGSWSSSTPSVATISASGVVTGVSTGLDTVIYTISSGCGTVSTSKIITSGVAPSAGTITGISAICQGAITTLSDATSGGSWSSANNAIATVNSSGVVTGVSGGNTNISYTVSGSCGSVSATKLVLITPLPSPGTISGTMAVCVGSNTTLADTASGGTWTSGSTSLATVNSSGVVTGVATGTATISYTKTNSCGSATATASVAVQTAASAGTISGTTHICAGLTSTLSETVSGGSWSSSNSTIASINSSTGVITGVAAGSANITYTVTNSCGSVTTSTSAIIDPAITTGTISGTPVVCPGATTSLSDAVSGGVWSSSNSSVATVSTTGTVIGVATGTTIISYTITNTCGSASAVDTVTVSPAPTAGTITGTTTLCTGTTVTLSDAVSGGTWTSSNTAIATVNASGVVRGVTAGTVTISYTATNSCGTATATQTVTVNTTPSAGSISGSTTVCPGVTTTLVDGVSGGTWSSSNTTIASINSSGVVRGISAGTVTISYIVTTSCGTGIATMSFSVTPSGSAGTITGTTTICTGTTSTLADATSGGTWSSGATGIATVSASGVVRGVSVGSATISYTVASSCGTASATKVVSIITTPSAGTITGTTTVCAGSTTTLSDTVSGGSWASSNPSIATVNASGIVTGVSAGTATITYTVSFTCGSASTTRSVTVNPLPVAGTISGTATICTGTTSTLSSTSSGGTWSSSNTAIATVSASGVVTAVATGNATVSYAVTNSCGTANSTYAITVITGASAGTITGASAFCAGTPSTFTETISGGTWSSSNTAVATVSASGLVVGVSGGSVTISYGVTSSCATAYATKSVTINPTPVMGAITGSSSVCVSSTTTFADTTTGGTWMSSNNTIATVSTTGMVTGVSSGTATISYYKTNSCGTSTVTLPITVGGSGSAGTITGTTAVCTGSTSTLTDAVSGGTWSSSNTAVAIVSTTGVVTGVSSGTATISYTVSGGCGTSSATATVTVSSAVSAGTITGTTTFCAGTTSTLVDAVSGGTWSSGNPSVATVNASGVVTGVMGGSVIISYTVTSSCGSTATATTTLTVNALPSIATISGARSLCMGTTATLSDATGGGTWSSTNTSVATISTTGTVTAVSTGTTIISYAVTNSCGTSAALDTITVNAAPSAGSITGSGSVCTGSITTLSDLVTGGVWSSSSPAIASVSPTGVVAGISAGTTTISYTVTNSCGTAVATMSVTVSSSTSATISGTTSVCTGATSTLSASISGGAWSSSNNTIATVSSGGTVTGVTAGTVTISYMVTTSCGSALAMTTFTVTSGASAGTISGSTTVCVASVTTLTDGVSGGSWTSSNTAIATVDAAGNVTGVSAGSVTISYTVSGSCGTASATHTLTVGSTPSAGFITGATALCTGSSITLVDATSGGTWSSSSTSIATVSSTGVVTGVTAGSVTISYTVTSSCGTAIATTAITVGTGVSAGTISGTTTMCAGSASTLTDAASGGTWSSSNPSVVTINASGTVTGVAAGTATISYTVTGSCGSASATTTVVINPMPSAATITGTTGICLGTTTTLSDVVTGGTWSSTNTSIATISSTGIVTSVAAGTTTISYTVVNSCGTAAATVTFTVGTAPSAGTITGAGNICSGTSTTLSDAVTGGTWSSSNPSIATISATGVVTGSGAGAVTISYTVTNSTGCSATATFGLTVGGTLASSSITPGGATLCGGSPVTLTVVSSATGLSYQWYKNGVLIAGATTATFSATTTGVYKAAIANTCASDTLAAVTVVASPNPVITVVGAHTLSTGSFAAYQWYFNGSAIPGATNSTYSYSVGGVYTVRVTDGNGCSITSAGKTVTTGGGGGGGGNVGIAPVVTAEDVSVYPNPATAMIHINAPVKVNVAILTPLGKVVIEQKDAVDINTAGIADGLYMIMIYDENNTLLKAAKLIKLE